jgi:hypothetical protein
MAAPALYKEADRSIEHSSSDETKVLNKQLNIRVSDDEIESIDDLIRAFETATPGLKITRSEMARVVLLRGLKSMINRNEDE